MPQRQRTSLFADPLALAESVVLDLRLHENVMVAFASQFGSNDVINIELGDAYGDWGPPLGLGNSGGLNDTPLPTCVTHCRITYVTQNGPEASRVVVNGVTGENLQRRTLIARATVSATPIHLNVEKHRDLNLVFSGASAGNLAVARLASGMTSNGPWKEGFTVTNDATPVHTLDQGQNTLSGPWVRITTESGPPAEFLLFGQTFPWEDE